MRATAFHALGIAWAGCFLAATPAPAADETELMLKALVKEARAGHQDALAPLKDLYSHPLAPEAVITIATDHKTGLGLKLRLAEIVAGWPAGEARKTLAGWLSKHPNCDEDELLFFANLGLQESRLFFWNLLAQVKAPPAPLRDPVRTALAAKALGAFQDNPEPVVTKVATLLDPAYPHTLRACAADALGGMRHPAALQALLPLIKDDALSDIVRRSLYRLTGQDLGDDADKWKEWITYHGASVPWKMLSRLDFDTYLKTQKLLKPLSDDPAAAMASFYGAEFKAKGALFILDVSGSMSFEDRISKLRAQMLNLLTGMQNKAGRLRYGILTFGDSVDSCFSGKGIAINDDKSHHQATRFIERIQAEGGTPMCQALSHALTKILPDGNLDAVYFLSDGSPSDGTPEQVLDLAQRIHERYQTRIHTISIGEETDPAGQPSLLQQIATTCGGTFTIPP